MPHEPLTYRSAGVDIDEARIREALEHRTVEARRQLMQSEG